MFAPALLAFAFVLAGCSGGSGPEPPPAIGEGSARQSVAGATAEPAATAECDDLRVNEGTRAVTSEDFALVDDSMERTISLARAGDVMGATATFLHEAHAFSHVIDYHLRSRGDELGVELYDAVVDIETTIAKGAEAPIVAVQSGKIRDLLLAAAASLGCSP